VPIVPADPAPAFTKRQLVEQAFSECALNGWEYDITADEKDTALTRLDTLMWELLGRGYDLGYNFPGVIGGGDLDDAAGIPPQAFNACSIMLATRLCPTMGKTQAAESRRAMTEAMRAIVGYQTLGTMQLSRGTPIGSGNKPWATRNPFTLTDETGIT